MWVPEHPRSHFPEWDLCSPSPAQSSMKKSSMIWKLLLTTTLLEIHMPVSTLITEKSCCKEARLTLFNPKFPPNHWITESAVSRTTLDMFHVICFGRCCPRMFSIGCHQEMFDPTWRQIKAPPQAWNSQYWVLQVSLNLIRPQRQQRHRWKQDPACQLPKGHPPANSWSVV